MFNFNLIFLIFFLYIPLLVPRFTHPKCFWRMKPDKENDGDLVTGCVFFLSTAQWPVEKDYFNHILNIRTSIGNNQFSLALAFSMDEVNKNPDLLPNTSLVFDFPGDGCKTVPQVYSLLHFSEETHDTHPNYNCDEESTCILALSGPNWAISEIFGTFLQLFTFQTVFQLTYGPFDPILSNREQFPSVYQMAPQGIYLAQAMVSLMLHFNWNWIGLAISDNDQGIQFLSYLRREMEKNTVCFAFVNIIPVMMPSYLSRAGVYYNQIMTSSTKVVVIYGDIDSALAMSFRMWDSRGIQRIWVTTSQWDGTTWKSDFTLNSFHGTLVFAHHHAEISSFKTFVQTLNPLKYSDEYLAKLEWMNLKCELSDSKCKTLNNCISNASLQWLKVQTFDMTFSDESYDIYNAVYIVAHALHEMILQEVHNQPVDNGKGHYAHCLKMPPSVCSVDCGPGFRKFWQEGMAACCFDCNPCPQHEVSNDTNVDKCLRCREDQYTNREQNQCIPKAVVFLNYKDPMGMALALMALFLSAFTAVVLGVFVKHRDTSIVKANNRNLTYILLISLIFSFLCPLLFIGHPNSATCILQQVTFGVVFTVAVSTVLAKTVTVLLAFKVIAPGKRIRSFLLLGAPNYIIAICTFIQIILCALWLRFSPPFIDNDANSEHGQIIIVCNKGSETAFYCVLGYHGSLALVSFIVAFLARNLPDTFNEAKLLTFSMLLFCSVWVTFIPVYHSTKGKVMVVVEVLSILISSAGLLGCIFVPKCYIILLRPERNSLQKLREKTSF